MPGALAGVASCARCGTMQAVAGMLCQSCGTVLAPAAQGSVLGTYTPLLAGVARSSAARGYVAVLVDVLPLAAAAAVAAVAAAAADFRTAIVIVVSSMVFAVVQALLFVRRGRTLGRLVLGLRTVEDLTGNPVGVRRLRAHLITSHRIRRTVTADLARGRDPLTTALPPLPGSALAEGMDEAVFAASGQAAAALPTSEAVAIVFDTGRRQVIHTSLLIGRSPEANRAVEQRGTTSTTGELAVLALADLSRTLSKTHALLEWSGSVLWVTDLHSANGSVLVGPDGERRPLVPGIRGPAAIGWTVECGNRSFSVHGVPQRAGS
jgi:RDD family